MKTINDSTEVKLEIKNLDLNFFPNKVIFMPWKVHGIQIWAFVIWT